MPENDEQNICYPQPHTLSQRLAIARDFIGRFHYTLPLASDTMDNRADFLYGAWPERIYVIDETGRIAYRGKLGPFGFHPEDLSAWLAKRFPRADVSEKRFPRADVSEKRFPRADVSEKRFPDQRAGAG